jgi:hypothetical protein
MSREASGGRSRWSGWRRETRWSFEVSRCGWTSAWSDPSRVTEEVARGELARAQANVEELFADPAFKQLVADRELRYQLVNDYDTGRILLCTLRDGGLDWAAAGG